MRGLWRRLSPQARLTLFRRLDPDLAEAAAREWAFIARDSQWPPDGDWDIWLILAGRGFGKTRTGAETISLWADEQAARRIALIGPTAADVRDVMVEGESGLLAVAPPGGRPRYEPSKRRLTWPNGAIATTFSADEPDRLRGPQHDAAWCDELAAWRYPDAWDMLMFGLRLGDHPRAVVTTTPRPVALVRDLLANPRCTVTRGSTFDNTANLAPPFLTAMVRRYQGSRLGRQELYAEVLEDTPGALWSRGLLDRHRIAVDALPPLRRIIVALDPAVTAGEGSDETGLVVAGRGDDGRAYVLADLSGRYPPEEWARRAAEAYRRWQADRVVAEANQGGDMVRATLKVVDPLLPVTLVHASRGKAIRAEPVAALYAEGRVSHAGAFPALEDQMTRFTPEQDRRAGSPDRVDALVWALTALMLEDGTTGLLDYYRHRTAAAADTAPADTPPLAPMAPSTLKTRRP